MRSVKDAQIFRAKRIVSPADIDMLGHASNIAVVRWIQDVAVAHSAALGLGFEAYRRIGGVFVIVRHEIDYLRPALSGDTLEMRTWIGSLMAAKCGRATEVARLGDGELVARALTTWGFVELATGRPKRMPDEVRAALLPGVALRTPPGALSMTQDGRDESQR
jgi:acyl-CoA thioester hydrolase